MSTVLDPHEVLRARALQLAQPPAAFDLAQKSEQLLLFERAGQTFALDVRFVREILPVASYTEVPFAPPICLGLVSARGELFALFDVPLLEAGAARSTTPKLMLLCGEGPLELALAADDALALVEPGHLLAPNEGESGLFAGVDARGFLVIDGAALLSDQRLSLSTSTHEIVP
jgi:purine-binding chemotaxis protein CheW